MKYFFLGSIKETKKNSMEVWHSKSTGVHEPRPLTLTMVSTYTPVHEPRPLCFNNGVHPYTYFKFNILRVKGEFVISLK